MSGNFTGWLKCSATGRHYLVLLYRLVRGALVGLRWSYLAGSYSNIRADTEVRIEVLVPKIKTLDYHILIGFHGGGFGFSKIITSLKKYVN